MEIYLSRQEANIIHIAAIALSSWHIYQEWDEFNEKATVVWNWFTDHDPEADAQPPPPAQQER